jgi:peptide/nickel transport system substrate-binding protein
VAPIGVNWSFYGNPEVGQLVVELKRTFDAARQDEITAKIQAKAVDDAAMRSFASLRTT